jgi:hypothetical protein
VVAVAVVTLVPFVRVVESFAAVLVEASAVWSFVALVWVWDSAA